MGKEHKESAAAAIPEGLGEKAKTLQLGKKAQVGITVSQIVKAVVKRLFTKT